MSEQLEPNGEKDYKAPETKSDDLMKNTNDFPSSKETTNQQNQEKAKKMFEFTKEEIGDSLEMYKSDESEIKKLNKTLESFDPEIINRLDMNKFTENGRKNIDNLNNDLRDAAELMSSIRSRLYNLAEHEKVRERIATQKKTN